MHETGFGSADFYDDVIARSGGEQSTAEEVVKVRRSIRIVLERWEAQGFNTWRIRPVLVTATGTTRYVPLPDCVDDVLHVLHIGAGGELTRYSPARYMAISNKDLVGRPSAYWLSREQRPLLYLHPTGVVGLGSPLEVWHVERPAAFDAESSAGHEDVPGRWLEALILACAEDLVRKRPAAGGTYNEPLIARLKGERLEAEDIARRADRNRVSYRYRMA